jgi:hypothetical protein
MRSSILLTLSRPPFFDLSPPGLEAWFVLTEVEVVSEFHGLIHSSHGTLTENERSELLEFIEAREFNLEAVILTAD